MGISKVCVVFTSSPEMGRCNIVDTPFHTSAFPGPTGPNRDDALLYRRKDQRKSNLPAFHRQVWVSPAGKQLRSEGSLLAAVGADQWLTGQTAYWGSYSLGLRHCYGLQVAARCICNPLSLFVLDFVTENMGRDIVDTCFHASRFTCKTWPNRWAFLLYGGKAERALTLYVSRTHSICLLEYVNHLLWSRVRQPFTPWAGESRKEPFKQTLIVDVFAQVRVDLHG
jgi:hypothetical protein